jgi:hypothetical protein
LAARQLPRHAASPTISPDFDPGVLGHVGAAVFLGYINCIVIRAVMLRPGNARGQRIVRLPAGFG